MVSRKVPPGGYALVDAMITEGVDCDCNCDCEDCSRS